MQTNTILVEALASVDASAAGLVFMGILLFVWGLFQIVALVAAWLEHR